MRHQYKALGILFVLLLCLPAALAQTRGALTVTATVRSSVLLSGTTPGGASFSEGGEQSASVTITVPPAADAQSFSTGAVVANNSKSSGYDLIAKLAGPGDATIDGLELSTGETVIVSQAAYGTSEKHSIAVSGPDAVTIILTCRPR